MPYPAPRPVTLALIEAKSIPEPNTGCWLWTANRKPNGYPLIWLNGKSVMAHRALFEVLHGPLASSQCVLHSCDVPSCVNPAHLRAGSRADNMRDAINRRRLRYGSDHHFAKMDEWLVTQIRTMRRDGWLWTDIAKNFNRPLYTIYYAGTGRSWKELV